MGKLEVLYLEQSRVIVDGREEEGLLFRAAAVDFQWVASRPLEQTKYWVVVEVVPMLIHPGTTIHHPPPTEASMP